MVKLRALAFALVLACLLSVATVTPASANHKPCHPKSLCQVPEVPMTLLLPAASAGLAGAYYVVNRMRGGGDGEDE